MGKERASSQGPTDPDVFRRGFLSVWTGQKVRKKGEKPRSQGIPKWLGMTLDRRKKTERKNKSCGCRKGTGKLMGEGGTEPQRKS